MASKHTDPGHADSSDPSRYPPPIYSTDAVLSSVLPLPPNPSIAYAVFTPLQSDPFPRHNTIELARRQILIRNGASSLLQSCLSSVHINREPALFIYFISSRDGVAQSLSMLHDLQLDGLIASELSSFTPDDIYPCSPACSTLREPCSSCLNSRPLTQSPSALAQPLECLLPRQPLRRILSHFLEAVRDRLIDDCSKCSKNNLNTPPVVRLKSGFLLSLHRATNEWGIGWEQYTSARPMVYCHLELGLTPSRIVIHPVLRPTHFLPLHSSLPLPSGSPIILIPHATPAYFLAVYVGPTSVLTTEFDNSLAGLGVGEWKTLPNQCDQLGNIDCISTGPLYIIAWVSVENKNGEEKGVTVIWPTRLCLSFLPSSPSAHARLPLSYIPRLPSQLQSSSVLPDTSTHPLANPDIGIPGTLHRLPVSGQSFRPSADPTRSLRVLTSPKVEGINKVVTEVGAYVDAIARERERERERIRRERESAHSSQPSRNVVTATADTSLAAVSGVMESSASQTVSQNALLSHTKVSVATIPSQLPSQLFYPSPPQSNFPPSVHSDDMQTSPAVKATALPQTIDGMSPQLASSPDDTHMHLSPSFDPFGDFDSSWSQQPGNDFMSIDFGMGLHMDIDPITGSGGAGADYDRRGMDYEDAFTDDDFSFFDQPSKGPSATTTALLDHVQVASVLTPLQDSTPLQCSLLDDDIDLSGPNLPTLTPGQHILPSSLGRGDVFTSKTGESDTLVPESMPLNPGQSPWAHSALSPNVQLLYECDHVERPRLNTTQGLNMFDPIQFASCHRAADGKYAGGKFALPSLPRETSRPRVPSSPSSVRGWRSRYDALTDPRVGVLRKLEVKKESVHRDATETKVTTYCEDWVTDADNTGFEADSNEEDVEEISYSPVTSKPSTPPPVYIPLGPTLLHSQFHHCQLLPISSSLKPSSAIVAAASIMSPPALTSVPTPVSPAAMTGVDAEKSKSLEATALTIAREVVENGVWLRAWQANNVRSSPLKPVTGFWQADVLAVNDILESVPGLKGPLTLHSLFQCDTIATTSDSESETQLQPLESPMISVGKADAVIRVLPSALRFWRKLGLRPRGKKKDVTAFVVFEEEGEERQQQVESWLGHLSAAYSGKNLGQHTPGNCSTCPKNGLVPLPFDAFRKNLLAFIRSLPNLPASIIFYIVTPPHAMSLTSPFLRQVFSAAKRAVRTTPDSHVLLQIVPSYAIAGSLENPAKHDADFEMICFSVYDRIPQPVDRSMSRPFFELGEKVRGHIPEPAFSLARPVHNKVKLLWRAPARSLDVTDRHTLLHVGYQITPCGKWILAVCMDQRGEAHDIGVWLTRSESNASHLAAQVWGFALQFARKASIEWRVAIAKLGPMDSEELDAWMVHLGAHIPACHDLLMMHVSLLSVEPEMPWTFIASRTGLVNTIRASSKDRLGSSFLDGSASTYVLLHSTRLPLSPILHCGLASEVSFVSDADETAICENLSILPLSTTNIVRVPNETGRTAVSMLHVHLLHTVKSPHSSLTISDKETHLDITRNYHELAVLAKCRWSLEESPLLPFHLAAVDAMQLGLDAPFDG